MAMRAQRLSPCCLYKPQIGPHVSCGVKFLRSDQYIVRAGLLTPTPSGEARCTIIYGSFRKQA